MNHSTDKKRILIAIDASAAYQRQMLRGIISYSRQHKTNWEYIFNHRPEPLEHKLKANRAVDGIILHEPIPPVLSEVNKKKLKKRKASVVLIEEIGNGFPTVISDNQLIGKMAFEHFADKGFKHFAFYEQHDIWIFKQRKDAFENAAKQAGMNIYQAPNNLLSASHTSGNLESKLGNWLVKLPKPLALFVGAIMPARQAVAACKNKNIAVPDEVAILGVGHDEIDCQMIDPPLSAIDQGMQRGGFKAAGILDSMLKGGNPNVNKPILIPPASVVERQSTDILAVDDPDVRKAVHWIRDNALRGANITQMLKEIPLARRSLEVSFKNYLGKTMHEEIMRVRIEKAKYLLLNSQLQIPEIAQACGFNYASRFIESFKKNEDLTPVQFRHQYSGYG